MRFSWKSKAHSACHAMAKGIATAAMITGLALPLTEGCMSGKEHPTETAPAVSRVLDGGAPSDAGAALDGGPSQNQLIILTRPMFEQGLERLAQARTAEGFNVTVVDYDDLPAAGRDSPERIREFLKTAKQPEADSYLLLVGDVDFSETLDYTVDQPWEIPVRYLSVHGAPYANTIDALPTDQYYASLSGSWDDNGNGIFGELGQPGVPDEFGFSADFKVGRIPVRTVDQLDAALNVILSWAPKDYPVHSVFQSGDCAAPSDGIKSAIAGRQIGQASELGVHICLDDGGGDIAQFMNSDGTDLMSSFSEGSLGRIIYSGSSGYYLNSDGTSSVISKPAVFMVYACYTNAFDWLDTQQDGNPPISLSKELFLSGQAAAYVGATREIPDSDSGFDVFPYGYLHSQYRMGDALYAYKEWRSSHEALSDRQKEQFLNFSLLGDPTMLFAKRPSVTLSVPESVVSGGQRSPSQVGVTLSNATGTAQSGTLENPVLISGGGDTLSSDAQLSSVQLGPYSTQAVQAQAQYSIYNNGSYSDTAFTLGFANADGSAYSAAESIAYSGHLYSAPESLINVTAGAILRFQVKVLYGIDEVVQLASYYYPGCTGSCGPLSMPGTPQPNINGFYTILYTNMDLSQGRDASFAVTMPAQVGDAGSGTAYIMTYFCNSTSDCYIATTTPYAPSND